MVEGVGKDTARPPKHCRARIASSEIAAYICHITCGITKYMCGLALCRLSDRIFTFTSAHIQEILQ